MNTLQAAILGVVEGVTEFLPISSTGHLILAGKLFGIENNSFTKSFEITIQLGAILAVIALYWKRFFLDQKVWSRIFVAFLPTALLGFLFYKILKQFLLSNSFVVLWSLFLGGVFLILFEIWQAFAVKQAKESSFKEGEISYKKSFVIGIIQALSIIPGVSRAGATIVGGLLLGIKREAIVEFSFLLAIPTMAAATAYDLYKSAGSFSLNEFHLLALGFIVSFVVAMISIKWLLRFIKNHTFVSFGVYRIIVAVLFWLLVAR